MTLVLVELTQEPVNWQHALQGWDMKESQYIRGWLDEGELRGLIKARREDLLMILTERIAASVPEDTRLAVERTNDRDILQKGIRAAARSNSWAGFHAAMKNGA